MNEGEIVDEPGALRAFAAAGPAQNKDDECV